MRGCILTGDEIDGLGQPPYPCLFQNVLDVAYVYTHVCFLLTTLSH
jgi:hypothetical protein